MECKIIQKLIEDENEAVAGYDMAMRLLKMKHPEMIPVLQHIRDEELKHIAELNELIFDKEEEKI